MREFGQGLFRIAALLTILAAPGLAWAGNGQWVSVPVTFTVEDYVHEASGPGFTNVTLYMQTFGPYGFRDVFMDEPVNEDGTFVHTLSGEELPGTVARDLTDGIPGALYLGMKAAGVERGTSLPDFALGGENTDLAGYNIQSLSLKGAFEETAADLQPSLLVATSSPLDSMSSELTTSSTLTFNGSLDVLTSVPEASETAVLLGGLAMLYALARRRLGTGDRPE